ncbi:unnamed protein product [Phytophthora lilii]|uniref:Unnamed protein product n=1 Tax=Phytophthora lilii TaxID=2077276 RepID=A0A9W6X1U6_9STRA|nr:unnamed protein product [Phytophthora lilii]
MFRQEADLWFTLNHSNVIKLYGACYEGRQPFFVCERATSMTLTKYLDPKEGRSREKWFRLLQAAHGLQHLHDNNIVHGDLKGDNILICDGGAMKIADFGLSLFATRPPGEETQTVTGRAPWGKVNAGAIKYAVTKERKMPSRPPTFETHEWDLVEHMCCYDPQQRIGIGAVIKILEDIGIRDLIENSSYRTCA